MQITLNQAEVSDVVLGYVQAQLGLDDSNNFVVELNEDGITVLVNEDSNDGDQSKAQAEKPARRPRQPRKPKAEVAPVEVETKSAIELLKAGQVAEASGNDAAVSTEKPPVETQAAVVEAAGETTQEASGLGEQATDPSKSAEPAVVVEEQAAEPEVAEEPVTPKPTQSLFANLRKPNNQ